jgi:hypothetical protein
LKPYYEKAGYVVVDMDYGWTGPLSVINENHLTVNAVAQKTKELHDKGYKVVYEGHSNAGTIAYFLTLLADKESVPDVFVLNNPALKKNIKFGEGDFRVLVYYSPSDRVVSYGRLWSRLLPFWLEEKLPWGAMGRYGHTGNDDRVDNINAQELTGRKLDHSSIFKYLKTIMPTRLRIVNDRIHRVG